MQQVQHGIPLVGFAIAGRQDDVVVHSAANARRVKFHGLHRTRLGKNADAQQQNSHERYQISSKMPHS